MVLKEALMNGDGFVKEDDPDQIMRPFIGCYFAPSDEDLGTLLCEKNQ